VAFGEIKTCTCLPEVGPIMNSIAYVIGFAP
jgi:hypothetical protein